jgi:hypothetical protein
LHGNSAKRAIKTARPAFHARITILNNGMRSIRFKNFMRADFQTHSTAGAFIFIQLQSNDIFKVGHIIHFKLLCPFDSFHSREDNSTTVFFCGIALNKAKSH